MKISNPVNKSAGATSIAKRTVSARTTNAFCYRPLSRQNARGTLTKLTTGTWLLTNAWVSSSLVNVKAKIKESRSAALCLRIESSVKTYVKRNSCARTPSLNRRLRNAYYSQGSVHREHGLMLGLKYGPNKLAQHASGITFILILTTKERMEKGVKIHRSGTNIMTKTVLEHAGSLHWITAKPELWKQIKLQIRANFSIIPNSIAVLAQQVKRTSDIAARLRGRVLISRISRL